MKIDRQALFKFLRRLNKQLSNRFVDLKVDFEKNPPVSKEIKKRFIEWKTKYDHLVISILKQLQDIDQKSFSFKQYIVKATEEFGTEQEFVDLLKNVNSSIEGLKDFIRANLIRDPTIYEGKQ